MKYKYPARYYQEDNLYWVEFPDLVGCQTYGDTLDETRGFAKEVLELFITGMIKDEEAIPPASNHNNIEVKPSTFIENVEVTITTETLQRALKQWNGTDLELYNKALAEHNANPIIHSTEDVANELGL